MGSGLVDNHEMSAQEEIALRLSSRLREIKKMSQTRIPPAPLSCQRVLVYLSSAIWLESRKRAGPLQHR
jgi:hypothetical protein